jgi:hypothetical protein
VRNNGKRNPDKVLAVLMGLVFAGDVWAQTGSIPGVFSGTVTKVDRAKKEFAVQNAGVEMIFLWTEGTQVNRPPAENFALDSKDLKEGMDVTVTYSGRNPEKIANWIYVKPAKVKALKGLWLPFECGVNSC